MYFISHFKIDKHWYPHSSRFVSDPLKMNCCSFAFRFVNISFGFVLLCTYVAAGQKPELPKVRGISTSRVGLYDPELDFTCLDGSKTIPFTQVLIC